MSSVHLLLDSLECSLECSLKVEFSFFESVAILKLEPLLKESD